MSFTPDDVRDAIEILFGGGEHTVDGLYSYLRHHPVVLPPAPARGVYRIGAAELVDKGEDDYHKWFVFRIDDRHFRAATESNSSFGDVYYSTIQEVEGVTVQSTEWKPL